MFRIVNYSQRSLKNTFPDTNTEVTVYSSTPDHLFLPACTLHLQLWAGLRRWEQRCSFWNTFWAEQKECAPPGCERAGCPVTGSALSDWEESSWHVCDPSPLVNPWPLRTRGGTTLVPWPLPSFLSSDVHLVHQSIHFPAALSFQR